MGPDKSGRGGEKERECVGESEREAPIRASGKNERERGRESGWRHDTTRHLISYVSPAMIRRPTYKGKASGLFLRSERNVRLPRKLDTSTVSIAIGRPVTERVTRAIARDKSAKLAAVDSPRRVRLTSRIPADNWLALSFVCSLARSPISRTRLVSPRAADVRRSRANVRLINDVVSGSPGG